MDHGYRLRPGPPNNNKLMKRNEVTPGWWHAACHRPSVASSACQRR